MGFVKLPDDLNEWAWYNDNIALLVYIRLRVAAKYKAADVGNVHLERGQVATSIREIAETNSVSVRQARTALERLKATNKIAIKSTSKISIITLIDYDCEFESDKQNDTLTTSKRQTERQADDTLTTNNRQASDTPSLLTTDRQICREQSAENTHARETTEKNELKAIDVKRQHKPEKRNFAEFVSMTNEEYSSLVTKLGEQGAKRCIEILDNYKGQSGKTYKSDYRAILNWVITRYSEEQSRQKPTVASEAKHGQSSSFAEMLKELDNREGGGEIDV